VEFNYQYCCKKLRKYVDDISGCDFSFDVKRGKFHWGELEYGAFADENTFYMEYCPFCGEKISAKIK